MKRYFRALLDALQSIASTLHECHVLLATGVREWSGIEDFENRVAAIEREMDKREAQAEATLERAESKFRSARAAEERARHFANAAERDKNGDEGVDLEDDELQAYLEAIREQYAGGGPEEGVQPVRGPVASRQSDKEALRARKLGGM